MKSIKLGNKVRDAVTGFTGIAISRIEFLNGCVQYGVKPKADKDGKDVDCCYIDEGQLRYVSIGLAKPAPKKSPGGDQPDRPRG